MSSPRVTRCGKQILLDARHLADARDDEAAEMIAYALDTAIDDPAFAREFLVFVPIRLVSARELRERFPDPREPRDVRFTGHDAGPFTLHGPEELIFPTEQETKP